DNCADDSARLIVTPVPREIGKGSLALRALQEDRIALNGQNAGCTFTAPPLHERPADLLLGFQGHLEHCGRPPPPHWQEMAVAAQNRMAVRGQSPSAKIFDKHRVNLARQGQRSCLAL